MFRSPVGRMTSVERAVSLSPGCTYPQRDARGSRLAE